VDNRNIDASVGLAFSLPLFERYRQNGVLQAEVHHVPGVRGRCMGFVHLVEGKVVSCYLEEKDGQRRPITKELLTRVDSERGPFEWKLKPLPSPPSLASSPSSQKVASEHRTQSAPVPRIVAPLDMVRLEGWSDQHKLMLSMVYEEIDGMRNIEEIKQRVPLTPNITEEALRILLALKSIVVENS
jgi:hypothetical protein